MPSAYKTIVHYAIVSYNEFLRCDNYFLEKAMPVTIPVTLPDDLAEKARIKGLLTSASLAMIISKVIDNDTALPPPDDSSASSGMDPRLEGAVNPLAFKRGTIIGDVVEPPDIEWEAEK